MRDHINTLKAIFIIYIAVMAAVMVLSFKQSMPKWCATPEGTGNHLVQPFCKR